MKIIDEKGKLFGKLNIIDLLVIVLVIAAAVVVGAKFLGGSEHVASTPVASKLTFVVHVTAWDAESVDKVGEYVDAASGKKEQLLAGSNLLDAYIVDYWTKPTEYKRLNTGSIEMLDPEKAAEVGLIDAYFKIEANAAEPINNKVGTQEVRIGKTHIVKSAHLEFDCGVIVDCDWENAG